MANRIALVRLNTHGRVNEGIFQFGRRKIGVVDPFPTDDLKLRDIAIDSEDRVVMLLSSSAPHVDKHFILRMTPDGNKDHSFSQDAQREISEGRSDNNASHHLVIDENDRIIVGLGKSVRRQGFWHQWQRKLRGSSAHLVGCIMRRVVCDASGAFRASFV